MQVIILSTDFHKDRIQKISSVSTPPLYCRKIIMVLPILQGYCLLYLYFRVFDYYTKSKSSGSIFSVQWYISVIISRRNAKDTIIFLPSSASTSTKSLAEVSLNLPTHPPTPTQKSILTPCRLYLNYIRSTSKLHLRWAKSTDKKLDQQIKS